MRAWRKALNLSNVAGAGHLLSGSDFRLSPETFANRHYIFRDQAHAYAKYANRVFDAKEVAHGWHWDRSGQLVANFIFPPTDELECLASPGDRNLSRSHPHKNHYWLWKAQVASK